jgi:hypothetical protein
MIVGGGFPPTAICVARRLDVLDVRGVSQRTQGYVPVAECPFHFWCQLIQPERRHFGVLAVSSAKPDNIFWETFEETLFTWLI